MSTVSCKHGVRIERCPICFKRPGECDFGSCVKQAAVTHIAVEGERRRMCVRHGERAARLYGGRVEKPRDPKRVGDADYMLANPTLYDREELTVALRTVQFANERARG